ncbi:MAG: GH3 auxin-responsive promoter, partial [Chitinophagaceae bacterium]
FIAYQDRQYPDGMKLVLNEHIFFEFVPFNEENFDADGNIISNPTSLMIDEVEENKDYALLLSTNAGAWRYLIGDTIRLVNKEKS